MSKLSLPIPEIGMGYQKDTGIGTGTFCLNTTKIKSQGTQVAFLDMSLVRDSKDVQKSLGFSLTFTIGTGGFNFDLAINFAKSTQDTNTRLSYTFIFNTDFESETLLLNNFGETALNDFGREVIKSGVDRFYEVCGDSFVIQQQRGAQLFVTVNLLLNSKKAKDYFDAMVDTSLKGIFELALEFVSNREKELQIKNFMISAFQLGGDTMRLSKVLGKEEELPILECHLESKEGIQKCQKVIDEILYYTETDFIEQSRELYKTSAIKRFLHKTYSEIGIGRNILDSDKGILNYLYDLVMRIDTILSIAEDFLDLTNKGGAIDQFFLGATWNARWTWSSKFISYDFSNKLNYIVDICSKLKAILQSKQASLCYIGYEDCGSLMKSIEDFSSKQTSLCYLEHEDCEFLEKDTKEVSKKEEILSDLLETGTPVLAIDPLKFLWKIYILNINCKYSDNDLNTEHISHVLFPIAKNIFYEHSNFQKSLENTTTNYEFHNIYEILISEDKQSIEKFKISRIDESVGEYFECGEIYLDSSSSMIDFYKTEIFVERNYECIKNLCPSGDDLTQIVSAEITLYQQDSFLL